MGGFSVHGFVIALLQLGFVLGLVWIQWTWRRRRMAAGQRDLTATVVLLVVLIAEYALLRWQPVRMGGSWFEYTLGLFDGFTVAGVLLLVMLQRVQRPPL